MNELNLSSVEQTQSLAVVPKTVEASLQEKKTDELNQRVVDKADKLDQGQKIQEEQLDAAVTKLNDYIQNVQRDLEFRTDDASGKTIVTVIDRQTDEVVRQIPDEVALTMAQNLQQNEPLSLFNIKA